MNQSTLIKNIHLGIKKTNDMYMAWTGGWWLTAYGVENFMVGNVARFIMEQEDRPAYASLEVSFRELYYDGGQLPKGRRSKAKKDRNRLDLSFFNQTGKVQYALEFKKMWTSAGFKHDTARLAALLSVLGTGKGGPLTCAVFTCLVAANGSSRENTLDKLHSKILTYGECCDGYMTKLSKAVTFYEITSSLDYEDIGPVLTEDGTQALASLCVRMHNGRNRQE
ncbi:hypothetical protein QUW42_06275 [Desulfovibrio piger]|uniref:hypothetical protein n=1 Tax=Desulfovibrio piger TaxID=901 RepID=UPI0025A36CB4|nr:hypothetical protein [Desulfovibrio piger]MDM8329892.1 hypothetical protein [Desulfovibrio piger]